MAETKPLRTMRDVFLERLGQVMAQRKDIFLLSADFGSPKLDAIRHQHPDRFINVGIAEQNMINIAFGLSLEGMTVYAYAIAPFLTMRAYEQIRVNLALHAQYKKINVNLIGVGAGLSYDVSGPTHHCLEDLTIMRVLPHLEVFSPSDGVSTNALFDYTLENKTPKYFRFDGKPQPDLYQYFSPEDVQRGFKLLQKGKKIAFVSTGFMSQQGMKAFAGNNLVGVVDLFGLSTYEQTALRNELQTYEVIMTAEEGFKNRGGMDALIRSLDLNKKIYSIGFPAQYTFEMGSREELLSLQHMDIASLKQQANQFL
jgi:transketolase